MTMPKGFSNKYFDEDYFVDDRESDLTLEDVRAHTKIETFYAKQASLLRSLVREGSKDIAPPDEGGDRIDAMIDDKKMGLRPIW